MRRRHSTSALALLGAGTVLATGLAAGLAPTSATAGTTTPPPSPVTLPAPCSLQEALVADSVSGPDPVAKGEVIRFAAGTQSTLTNNNVPSGPTELDSPMDLAFATNGDLVTTDQGIVTGVPQVVRIEGTTGARTVVAGAGVGAGPALNGPYSIATEPTGEFLFLDIDRATSQPQVLRIAASGARYPVSSSLVGTGPALTGAMRIRELNGVPYVLAGTQVLRVDPVNGNRRLVSGPGRGGGPAFVQPFSAAGDASTGSIVVLDLGFGGTGALIRVDLKTGDRSVLSSNASPTGGPLFDGPFDVVRNTCDNAFYVLHTAATGVPGRVLRVDDVTGVRTLFGTYTASSPSSNISFLMRPLRVVVTPTGPSLPGGGG